MTNLTNKQLERLVDVVRNSHDENLIWDALLEIGDNGYEEAIPILIDIIKNEENNLIVNAAALALKEIGDNSAVETLVTALQNKSLHDKGTLAYSLEEFDCSKFIYILTDIFIHGSLEVRMSIYSCIEKIKMDGVSYNNKKSCIDSLEEYIKGTSSKEDKEQLEWLLDLFEVKNGVTH